MDQKKNNGPENEFEDDFDAEFSDADFADAEFDESEYAADGELDAEFDEEYADEEWQEEAPVAARKKQRSTSKKGLSFNTIVILGAVIVGGGVMAVTMMSKSSKQQQSISEGGIFQSILSIANVMDGTLFGSSEEASGEQVAATDQPQAQEGFLDNPDSINNNPPQPTPIAPSETESLTPMPEITGDNVPRAPEETPQDNENVAVVAPVTPEPAPEAEAPQPKAEDILKQAMANRERKAQGLSEEQEPPKAEEAPVVPPVADVKTPEPQAPAPLEIAKVETPAPIVPPAPVPAAPAVPDVSKEELAAKAKEIEELQKRLDEAAKNAQKLETELNTARSEKDNNAEQVSSLKKEVAELKARPVPAPEKKQVVKPEPVEQEIAEIAPAPKKAKPAKAKPKKVENSVYPSQQAEVSAASGSRWELRAAQPGRAWVSKPGARDMQSVEVGQDLAGIGRVTAISFVNGSWAVTGTQGQILQ